MEAIAVILELRAAQACIEEAIFAARVGQGKQVLEFARLARTRLNDFIAAASIVPARN